jgi:hypothetical protein
MWGAMQTVDISAATSRGSCVAHSAKQGRTGSSYNEATILKSKGGFSLVDKWHRA